MTYNIYDSNLLIDLAARGTVYTQTPPCEHIGTENFVWTIPADVGISQLDNMGLNVVTNVKAMAGVHTVRLVNTISFDSSVPNNDGDSFTPTIEFQVTIIDPCTDTTINNIDIDPITVPNGEERSVNFIEATVVIEEEKAGLG